MSINDQEVPEYLRPYFEMLKCAYPDGLGVDEYFPLLRALGEIMNHRGIAFVVSVFAKKHYGIVYNDVLASQSPYIPSFIPSSDSIMSVKERLIPCGYNQFLTEE